MRATRLAAGLLAALLGAALGGCGFQLRGQANLPPEMARTYIKIGPGAGPDLATGLRRALTTNGVTVVDDPKAATATLEVSNEAVRRRVIVKGPGGTAQEYELYYDVTAAVTRANGTPLLPAETFHQSRDLQYDEAAVLGRDSGETLARRDMRQDAAWALLRRLQALAAQR